MEPQVDSSQHGNSSDDSESCLGESQHVSIPCLMCLVFLLSFLLNTFSLWVFCCRMPSWTAGTTLQFHLAVSDAIAIPVTPMMAVYFAMGNNWPFGRFLCQVKIALLSSHIYGSTVFLTLISFHRYAAVVHYNRSSCIKQKQFVRKLCAGVWCALLIQSLIYAFVLPLSNNNQCLSIHQKNLTDSYFLINFILLIFGFLFPFLMSAVCYGRLANTLTRLNISTAKGLRVKEKSQRMIGMCLLIFGLCFLPLNVMRTIAVVLKKYFPQHCYVLLKVETAYYASWILIGVNSCLDPLLYCFGSQKFLDASRSLRIGQRDSPNRSDSENTQNQ
ncbi:P2Y purinoceptor 4 [Labrus bergylta]|uniref:P2Y purinoceptor 4 n=1 Tax=Labrus bergylta TaxID=56723 RepID=UPI0009B49864|nr:P2Y purinoceptor 4-like [Labrus bergylta]XP_020496788.1 P2Y purinoceptor 4-like [Labrus bergylta]XP_029134567.1 P2Y purinoceptor 4-like [Labrus bergylta]XP_029134568.1 P2Y purinoceptor 4-like [Labrus bergylta]